VAKKKPKISTGRDAHKMQFPPGRLRELMDERGWTPKDLQQKFGLATLKTVYHWLDGTKKPWKRKLDKFKLIFDLTESELYGLAPPAATATPVGGAERPPRDADLEEKTYYGYRTARVPRLESPELIAHLESRYRAPAFRLSGKAFPAAVVWSNDSKSIDPDTILGKFDGAVPKPLLESPIAGPSDYGRARDYIKQLYEAPPSPIRGEGLNYRMTGIDLAGGRPKIHGAYGWYYDNILTQYAMEWELKKALLSGGAKAVEGLNRKGTLPLREAVESGCRGNPALSGLGRCASITISTLLVFKRRHHGVFCMIRRRSAHVGVSPNMLHVVPAGMFEAKSSQDPWSISTNVWRELLEEVYGEEEEQQTGDSKFPDRLLDKPPMPILEEMLADGSAEFSATGLCCDWLNLRPEICTVLYAKDHRFFNAREMRLNWEYEKEGPGGTFAVPWSGLDEVIANAVAGHGMVASGAVCLGLGRAWMKSRFQM